MIIRTSVSALNTVRANQLKEQVLGRRRHIAKRTHRSWKPTAFVAYAGAFLFIITIVAIGYQPPKQDSSGGVANAVTQQSSDSNQTNTAPSVDELVATQIAAGIAERAALPIARNIAEISTTLTAKSELAQSDNNSIVKPQIIQLAANSSEIRSYTSVAGDTVDKLAAQFNISADTIRWANNLTSDAIEPGKVLQIAPANGIIYTVKDGDTTASIASHYSADEKRMIIYNDLEKGGLTAGRKILIPDGDLPATERPGYRAPVQQQWASTTPSYSVARYGLGFSGTKTWTIAYGTGRNSYAAGNCTAYAYNRRVDLGLPVGQFWGNAATWDDYARAAGYSVTSAPSVGAIMQNDGGYGHVAIVEEILPNGDLSISEMNAYVPGGGFNVVSGRIVPANNVGSYNYIH